MEADLAHGRSGCQASSTMADLPSGAVTFLFTDIEGSTRLVRQLRDGYHDVLADHQRLLRDAFSRHGGHEIDTQGDAFFYAFGSAAEAVHAAIEGQEALSKHAWPENAAVKVRIGIHSARASPVDGRYTGLAVNRASRICSAGHGGQILVSPATQSLLEDEEEELAAGLVDLGVHELKDIDRPVRLYQASVPGLPSQFPAPRGEVEREEPEPPWWRRRQYLAVAALVLGVAIAGAVFLTTRGSGGGLGHVDPNHVGVIDPANNEIVDQVQVDIRPKAIAVGHGAVWVGNLDNRTLTKIDTEQRTSLGTFPLDNQTPTGIAVGGGSVWVAHGALGKLSQVDEQFGQVAETIDVAGEALGTANGAVTFGEGSVWAVYGDSTLGRVDPTTVNILGRTFAGTAPAGVTTFGGYVWVVSTDGAQRFQPSTFESGPLGSPTTVGQRPTAIAAGEGAVWVANTGSDTVTRIDPGSPPTTETIGVGDGPVAIAVGAGAVWVANAGDGTIQRIDPDPPYKIVETIKTGNAPSGIAFGDGFVWVTVQAP
jgi:YVTN family beta-propeller protein